MLSYWEQQSFTKYNYAVVGGGLVGLSTALSIKQTQPEASVVVLERGVLPSGASTKNAGFACFGSLSELLNDIDQMGPTSSKQLVQDRWSGLQLLRDRVGDANLDYQNNGGYELLFEENLHLLNRLEQVNELLRPVFKKSVFRVCDDVVQEFGFNQSRVAAVVFNPLEGQIDAGAMMKSLLGQVRKRGIDYLTGAQVVEINEESKHLSLTIEKDLKILCQRVAICTNAFSQQLLPDLDIKPGRGVVLVTKPISTLKFKGVFHYKEGYYYFRNLGSRVLFGGARNLDISAEETTDFGINKQIAEHLEAELGDLILPNQQYEIDQKWSEGHDSRPFLVNFILLVG